MAKQELTVELFYSGTWNTVDAYVDPAARINRDRSLGSEPTPTSLTLELAGIYNPKHPKSPLYGTAGLNTPIRVTLDADVRFYGEIASFAPTRTLGYSAADGRGRAGTTIQASGILRRLGQGTDPLRSALYRSVSGVAAGDYVPHAYWPMEDGVDATQVAATAASVAAGTVSGDVTFAAEDDLSGSEPLPQLASGARIIMLVPSYTSTGQWAVQVLAKVPAAPASPTTLIELHTNGEGTNSKYRVALEPGSPDELVLYATDAATGVESAYNTAILDGSDVSRFPTEADFYGSWRMFKMGENITAGSITGWMSISNATFAGVNGGGLVGGATSTLRSVTVFAESDTDGIAFGHSAVFIDPTLTISTDLGDNAAAMDGWAGEQAHERVERLCREEDIPVTVEGGESQLMGPQPLGTLAAVFAECERTDDGILFEPRDSYGLVYRTGRECLNRPALLALDYAAQEVAPPLEPVLDDLSSRNDVTVQRRDGASARAVLESGPLSVLAPPDGIGRYTTQVDVNTETDDVLPDHAAWHLHKGTVDGIRYERVTVDLDAVPALATDAAAVDIGDVITIDNLPDDETLAQARLYVTGYTEHIGSHRRLITYTCIPAETFDVGVYGTDTIVSRYDSANSFLAAAATSTATALTVTTDMDHALWITGSSSPTFPMNVGCAGIRLPVSAIASSVLDAFGRTSASSWGSADSGQAYTTSGGSASDYSVSSGTGRQSNGTVNVFRTSTLDVGCPDQDLAVDCMLTIGSAATSSVAHWICARETDGSNHYIARLILTTGAAVTLQLDKRVAGSLSAVVAAVTIATGHVGGEWYRVRIQVAGTAVRAKAWLTSNPEPQGWALSAVDTSLTTGNLVSFRSRLESGNTNTLPVVFQYDLFEVFSPQTFTVTRSADGADKALAAGDQVRLWTPARYAL